MFEKSCKTSFQLNDMTLHPFILQASISRTYNLILEKVKETTYEELIEDKDYWELYVRYLEKEITYYFIDEKNGNTRVVILLYTPHQRGKAKKLLRQLVDEYKEEFDKYLYKYTYRVDES